jgi:hypothetical protein
MRRTLVAGTLALVVVVACSGSDEPSGVDGRLRVIGSAYPGVDHATAGTVLVYPAEDEFPVVNQPVGVEPFAELGVDATGEFRISLPPGTYMLAARTVSGYAWSMQRVEVNPGEYTPMTITCFR